MSVASVSASVGRSAASFALTGIDSTTQGPTGRRSKGETMPDGLRETTLLHWRFLIDMSNPRELNRRIDEISLASSGEW